MKRPAVLLQARKAPPVPKEIPSVPESISREQYVSLIRLSGFEPDDLVELRFTTEGIYATVFARDDAGFLLDDGDDGFARHVVFIPIAQ